MDTLSDRIIDLFEKEKIYLNPNLQLSDIALRLGVSLEEVEEVFSDDSLLKKVKH